MSNVPDRKAQLTKRLKEISVELKAVNKQFREISKKSKTAVKSAHQRGDESKVQELRKKMGL